MTEQCEVPLIVESALKVYIGNSCCKCRAVYKDVEDIIFYDPRYLGNNEFMCYCCYEANNG
jgi:hypothetical protein